MSDGPAHPAARSDPAAPLAWPAWYEPLRAPSWLVPDLRDDATRIVYCAEEWQETTVDADGRDLRLGLPLYLAEAARFGTNARPIAIRRPMRHDDPIPESRYVVRSAVAPGGEASVRLRVSDGQGLLGEIVRPARDERTLGDALEGLPHAVSEVVQRGDVRPTWTSSFRLPSGPALASYVRGQHACLRLREEPPSTRTDAIGAAAHRDEVVRVLTGLGALATSTPEPFPAIVFFGALLSARDAGSTAVGEFRLQANARCTTATDPHDPVYAIAALVLRVFGDRDASDRRIESLRAPDGDAMRGWLERVQRVP